MSTWSRVQIFHIHIPPPWKAVCQELQICPKAPNPPHFNPTHFFLLSFTRAHVSHPFPKQEFHNCTSNRSTRRLEAPGIPPSPSSERLLTKTQFPTQKAHFSWHILVWDFICSFPDLSGQEGCVWEKPAAVKVILEMKTGRWAGPGRGNSRTCFDHGLFCISQ